MELRQLKYFIGVAEALSFSNAAKILYVSQSALSQQISLLENEIGTQLFDAVKRHKERKVELTEAGKAFLIEAKKILALSEKAVETAQRIGSPRTVIRLGIFKRYELLALFKNAFPDIEIRVVELSFHTDIEKEILSENIDLAITILPHKHQGLSSKIYQRGYLAVALSHTHPLVHKEKITLADLRSEKYINVSKPVNPLEEQIEELCLRKGGFSIEQVTIQNVNSVELMFSLVSLEAGFSFIPSYINFPLGSNLVMKTLYNNDGSLLTDIEILMGLSYKTDTLNPTVEALVNLIQEPSS